MSFFFAFGWNWKGNCNLWQMKPKISQLQQRTLNCLTVQGGRTGHRPLPDRAGAVGPLQGEAGRRRQGDAVGLQSGEGVLPRLEDFGGEGPPRPPVEKEAGTLGCSVHEESGAVFIVVVISLNP